MTRSAELDIPVHIVLDRSRGAPTLSDQIALRLRQSILEGSLKPGDRLPALRFLAQRLAVARATVDGAYAQLIEEGYLESKIGSGTRVASHLPDETLKVRRTLPVHCEDTFNCREVSSRAAHAAQMLGVLTTQRSVPLAVVSPSTELAPGKPWPQIAARLARTPWKHAGYYTPQGCLALREAVADYARKFRGLICDARRVVITAGTQQGFALCSQVLFPSGSKVWVEDPCYPLMHATIVYHNLLPVAVPVDEMGLNVERGIELADEARGAFVTPSHQYPLGMAMSMERRLALIKWAYEARSWIVEDDYDSELRYTGRPFPALQGLDKTSEAVIYLGTFSKMLFPGLRLGYAIVPERLVDVFCGARLLNDRHSPEAIQVALAEYMHAGEYESHIRRVRAVFQKRREVLIRECAEKLGDFGDVAPGDQGMHVVFQFHGLRDDRRIAEAIRQSGVEVRPLSPFFLDTEPQYGLMLGFGGFTAEAIRAAVDVVRQVLDKMACREGAGE